ncbi:6,7-dimethyl-8-ribityllumazine synthase, partial [Pseudomonas aeruginosa]|uniref:6,7-dimethyl-8-ribityllumazine synthase n=1 Tax=Pseudomonas aeruginosa TaxID=287 RepID=UPI003D18C9A5
MLKSAPLRGHTRTRRKKMNIIEANVATPDARVAITIARFNNFINDSLLEGAIDALKRIGQVKDENITVVWVPGAYV